MATNPTPSLPESDVGNRYPSIVMLVTAAALAAALIWTALHRGPWYDEFYTWFVTRPDRPFGVALRESWLADNHPPLFNILVWAGGAFASSIETLRFINLLALGSALVASWLLIRNLPRYRPVAALQLLVLAGDQAILLSGTELRSYFMSLCVGMVLSLGLAIGWLEGQLAGRGQRLVLWAALLIGMNLHILTTLIIGALLLPFLAGALWHRNAVLFRQLIVPALAGGSLFLAVSAIQIPLWEANTAKFWIPAGFNAARYAIELCVQRAAEANPLIMLGALIGAALLALRSWKQRRLDPALTCMILLAAGVIIAAVLLIALHMLRPVVMERYLAAMIPAIALGLALGCNEVVRRLPRTINLLAWGVATIIALAALAGNARHTAARNSWNGTAATLGQIHRTCADTKVHIDPQFWNAYTLSLPPGDNKMVMARAYSLMAQRGNFPIEPATSRRISPQCPTLFWAEHDTGRDWDHAKILTHLQTQGFHIKGVWQYRIGDGWIASDRPIAGLEQVRPAR